MAVSSSMNIYQLKISLKGNHKPPIWRRVLISKDSTFNELHHALQSVMDWSNSYLHKFIAPHRKIRNLPRFDDYDKEFEIGTIYEGENPEKFETYYSVQKMDETKTKLCDYFKSPKSVIEYVYDFGDGLELEIVLEEYLPSDVCNIYPMCVSGRRACPPDRHPQNDDWKTKIFDLKSVKFAKFEEKLMAVDASIDIYQLRISLKNFKPPIWRRIHIPKNSTFKDLHRAIQITMNWSNCHLHQFCPPRPRRYIPNDSDEKFIIANYEGNVQCESWMPKQYNESKTELCDFFKTPKDLIEYEYDLGSTWYHEVVLEKILPPVPGKVYPVCVTGKRARPPEEQPEYSDDEWENEDFDPKSVDFSESAKRKRFL